MSVQVAGAAISRAAKAGASGTRRRWSLFRRSGGIGSIDARGGCSRRPDCNGSRAVGNAWRSIVRCLSDMRRVACDCRAPGGKKHGGVFSGYWDGSMDLPAATDRACPGKKEAAVRPPFP
jgi:hypothetical protein